MQFSHKWGSISAVAKFSFSSGISLLPELNSIKYTSILSLLANERILLAFKLDMLKKYVKPFSGNLLEDFYFDMKKGQGASSVADRVLHCRNAPSPGATSSLAIGKMIADKIKDEFKLS